MPFYTKAFPYDNVYKEKLLLTSLISKLIGGITIFELKELVREIEHLRSKMIKIKEGKYYSHPEVVAASQELDFVLDKYQEMQENIKLDKD